MTFYSVLQSEQFADLPSAEENNRRSFLTTYNRIWKTESASPGNWRIILKIMIKVPETSQGMEMLKSVNWKNNFENQISKSKSWYHAIISFTFTWILLSFIYIWQLCMSKIYLGLHQVKFQYFLFCCATVLTNTNCQDAQWQKFIPSASIFL